MKRQQGYHYSFVQIGAHKGEEAMVHAQKGNHCLLIEPVPYLFEAIVERYKKFPNVQIASDVIANKAHDAEFFFFENTEGLPWYADQIGSLSRNHLITLGKQDGFPEDFAERITGKYVKTTTLNALFKRYGICSIKSLLIDAEGEDVSILLDMDFQTVRVNEIIFERKHTDGVRTTGYRYNQLVAKLKATGFEVTRMDKQNDRAILRTDWKAIQKQTKDKHRLFFNQISKACKRLPYIHGRDIGIIYLAIGQRYLQEAIASATTLRICSPKIPVTIFTDSVPGDRSRIPFELRPFTENISPFKMKVDAMLLSPYQKTIFLDTDTFVLNSIHELFDILNNYDFCIAHGPLFEYEDGEFKFKDYENPAVFNTGVIGFTKTPDIVEMLKYWKESMKNQDDSTISGGTYCDQWYFNENVKNQEVFTKIKTAVLDNKRWNLRCYSLGKALTQHKVEELAIIHSKPWESEIFWDVDLYSLVSDTLNLKSQRIEWGSVILEKIYTIFGSSNRY